MIYIYVTCNITWPTAVLHKNVYNNLENGSTGYICWITWKEVYLQKKCYKITFPNQGGRGCLALAQVYQEQQVNSAQGSCSVRIHIFFLPQLPAPARTRRRPPHQLIECWYLLWFWAWLGCVLRNRHAKTPLLHALAVLEGQAWYYGPLGSSINEPKGWKATDCRQLLVSWSANSWPMSLYIIKINVFNTILCNIMLITCHVISKHFESCITVLCNNAINIRSYIT